MFDPVQCSVSRLESVPRVSWVSLVQLRQLLVDTIVASPARGGTDATTPTTIRDSNGTIPTTAGAAGLEVPTHPDETERALAADPIPRRSRRGQNHTTDTGDTPAP